MTELAHIRFDRDEHVCVATIAGEIDISNTAPLRHAINPQLTDTNTVIIDLTQTTFLDSAAIALLFDIAERLHTTRRTLYLVIPDDAPIRHIATISGLDTFVTIQSNLNDAKDAARGTAQQ